MLLKSEIGTILDMLCLQKNGAEIGEFLTPMSLLSYSYKKWTLVAGGNHMIIDIEGYSNKYLL